MVGICGWVNLLCRRPVALCAFRHLLLSCHRHWHLMSEPISFCSARALWLCSPTPSPQFLDQQMECLHMVSFHVVPYVNGVKSSHVPLLSAWLLSCAGHKPRGRGLSVGSRVIFLVGLESRFRNKSGYLRYNCESRIRGYLREVRRCSVHTN